MATIQSAGPLPHDPESLEQAYQTAVKSGSTENFSRAIQDARAGAPDDLLYAAWFYRLQYAAARAKGFAVAWAWAIPLALANGLLFWFLSDDDRFVIQIARAQPGTSSDFLPMLILLAAPIAGVFVLAYLAGAGRRDWRPAALAAAITIGAGLYVLVVYPQAGSRPFQEQYLTLMAMHLPLLAWAGVGTFLIVRHRDATNRFAFLMKSLEVLILGGLFAMAGGLFTAITIGLFSALNIELPEVVDRLFIAGGGGLIAVIAVAVVYNPSASPAEQSFDEGLSRLIPLTRLGLPLALLVLLIYLLFIPFNFRAPFDNRDVLIIYNAMLFAIVALLVGATPINAGDLSPRLARWLRMGIVAVAALTLLVSLYALAAILYRSAIDRMTPNRLTFIGWNVINIGLLALILLNQARAGAGDWSRALYRAFSVGTVAYTVWTLIVILALPWLFGGELGDVQGLPVAVQDIAYENEAPILLKCADSPHIYLLEDGEKRWIDTIATFNERGYVWRDVHFIKCEDLRAIPAGEPIPEDAGPPPEP